MYSTFILSKSECLSCTNKTLKEIGTLQGVFGAEVDRINGKIEVSHTDEISRDKIASKLEEIGFVLEKNEIEPDEPSIWGCAL